MAGIKEHLTTAFLFHPSMRSPALRAGSLTQDEHSLFTLSNPVPLQRNGSIEGQLSYSHDGERYPSFMTNRSYFSRDVRRGSIDSKCRFSVLSRSFSDWRARNFCLSFSSNPAFCTSRKDILVSEDASLAGITVPLKAVSTNRLYNSIARRRRE